MEKEIISEMKKYLAPQLIIGGIVFIVGIIMLLVFILLKPLFGVKPFDGFDTIIGLTFFLSFGASITGEIEKFKEKIRFARILEPLAVGTETGFFGPTQSDEANDTEEAYLRVLNTLRPIVAYAKEMGVNVAIEGVSIFVINSPRKLRRLIDDLGEDNVKAIFDPVNYVRANNTDKMDAIINETFELLSDRLVAIHAKDYAINPEGKLIYPDPALGELNYKLIFENMKKYSVDIPIILEGIPDDRAEASFARLEKIKNSI
jgi:sugar phosphate isomerase/epimerase